MEEDVFDMWSQDDESIIKKKKSFHWVGLYPQRIIQSTIR